MTTSLPYRPGVGVMLINKNGLIFVAKRIDMTSEAWQMPQGGIDDGEDPEKAMWRELEEEIGIGKKKAEKLGESKDWLTYDLPEELVPQIWGGKYRGQRQKWYALRFTGENTDINLMTKEPEFSNWKWATPAEVPTLIVPFKQTLYRELVEEFSALLAQ